MDPYPTSAREILRELTGKTIRTLTGRPNTILAIEGDDVIVGTERSPKGQPVPIEWIQNALDDLLRAGELEISVRSVGYRSAFVGAVLATVPGVTARLSPLRLILERSK